KNHRWKCSDTTVAILDDEEGDRLGRKLESKSLCGLAKVWSDPSERRTTQQAVAKANRSEAARCMPRLKRMTGVPGSAELVPCRRKAKAIGEELSACTQWTPRGLRGRHAEKERTVKARNHWLVAEVL